MKSHTPKTDIEARKAPYLVEMKLSELNPAKYNPRVMSATAKKNLREKMKRFGVLQPYVFNVRTKTLVGGHQRREIEIEDGIESAQVWCVDLSREEEKAANLMLNNHDGEWDARGLKSMLKDLGKAKIDLQLTGFRDGDLSKLLGTLKRKNVSVSRSAHGELPKFAVIVDCKTEAEQIALLQRLSDEGFNCKALQA